MEMVGPYKTSSTCGVWLETFEWSTHKNSRDRHGTHAMERSRSEQCVVVFTVQSSIRVIYKSLFVKHDARLNTIETSNEVCVL